jgi:hypothetical protein
VPRGTHGRGGCKRSNCELFYRQFDSHCRDSTDSRRQQRSIFDSVGNLLKQSKQSISAGCGRETHMQRVHAFRTMPMETYFKCGVATPGVPM